MVYGKPFLDYPALLATLSGNGLHVSDQVAATEYLKRVGYHRSGGYRYPFRELLPEALQHPEMHEYRSDSFISGTTFEDIVRLDDFDAGLRLLLAEALLEFEVRLRNAVTHVLASRSIYGHLESAFLDSNECVAQTYVGGTSMSKLDAWRRIVDESVSSALGDEHDALAHHILKYGRPIPIWTTLETLSFGKVPYLLDLLKQDDLNAVASLFGLSQGERIAAWSRSFVDLRNKCAHGSRVFNKSLKRSIKVTRSSLTDDRLRHLAVGVADKSTAQPKKLYATAAALAYALLLHESGSDWPSRFRSYVSQSFPTVNRANLHMSAQANMGFPAGWETLDLWQ